MSDLPFFLFFFFFLFKIVCGCCCYCYCCRHGIKRHLNNGRLVKEQGIQCFLRHGWLFLISCHRRFQQRSVPFQMLLQENKKKKVIRWSTRICRFKIWIINTVILTNKFLKIHSVCLTKTKFVGNHKSYNKLWQKFLRWNMNWHKRKEKRDLTKNSVRQKYLAHFKLSPLCCNWI